MLSLLAMTMIDPAIASTSLPYTETLGDVTTSGCDSQWDGDCETGWSGWGDTDTIEMVTNVTDSTVHGIKVTPGTSFWNGFWRDFAVTGGDVLEWKYDAIALDGGSADIALRVVFKNVSGATIDTKTNVETGFSDYGTISSWFAIPSSAVTAQVFMGVKNPGSAGDEVVVADVNCFMPSGCDGGFGGRELEDFYDKPAMRRARNVISRARAVHS